MKTLNTFIGFWLLLILSACTADLDFQHIGNQYVTLNLDFKSQGGEEIVIGRAATEAEEQKLYDLHFYIFNAEGRLTGYKKLQNSVTQSLSQTGTVSVRTKSGNSYIYAIANINESTTYYLDQDKLDLLNISEGTNDKEYWENIENSQLTREVLLNIQFKRIFGDANKLFSPDPSGKVFVMSGYINNGGTVNIPESNSNSGFVTLPKTDENYVRLYRILSKITLTINAGTNSNGTFTPKYYRLCNVPKGGALIPKDGVSTLSTYLNGNTTSADVESSYRWNFDGKNSITFYYPENLQVAKANSQISNNWQDREKNSWVNNVKTFTNAADKASYIEIFGDYSNSTGSVIANVNYTIHFGDFSADDGNMADFNLIRNYAYNYYVTFNGINDIIVEAEARGDRPYVEGMVVSATNRNPIDVDAHYEARVLTFNKADIQSLQSRNSGYILSVKTPFGETSESVNVKNDGIYRVGESTPWCTIENARTIFKNEPDYQWIKFVRNTTENKIADDSNIATDVCKYPGDESASCLNVFQLLAQLYDLNTYSDNKGTQAYYTCFIDENYYAGKSWTTYVNKDPRTMLIANNLQTSADGKSSYAEVAYSISQRSITTIYNTDYAPNGRLVKAFGTEAITEEKTKNVTVGTYGFANNFSHDNWDGWTMTKNANSDKSWETDRTFVTGAQPMYTTAAKACMSRNRDLNGNGTIEDTEVRWYLAAVDQYHALIFAQNVLDPDAYLIKHQDLVDINTAYLNRDNNSGWGSVNDRGNSYRSKYHYYTSSGGNQAVFWPEEGLTNNPLNTSWSKAVMVRCIRTLTSGGDGREDPEHFYTYDASTNTVTLGGIVATRDKIGFLPIHNELEGENNLYSSFVIASTDLPGTYSMANVTGDEKDVCYNEGNAVLWRTPNQKELALMVMVASQDTDGLLKSAKYGSRTRFSGSDYNRGDNSYWNWHNTAGFWTSNQSINVGGDNSADGNNVNVQIRCVRDGQ